MIETAKVVAVDKNKVVLECLQSGACAGCGSKGFCTTTARQFTALNKKNLILQKDDIVKVDLNGPKAIGFGFMSLIFPLILFITLYLTVKRLIPDSSDMIYVLFGFIGLAVGFLISWGVTRMLGTKGWPVIIKKESSEEENSLS